MDAYKPPLFDRIRNAAALAASAIALDLLITILIIF